MKLISFQLKNYKSFVDSGELNFSPGMNVLVGQNNAGKSALLEGISLRFPDKPHRSMRTKPTRQNTVSTFSEALFTVECEGEELRSILLNRGAQFHLPTPAKSIDEDLLRRTLDDLFSSAQLQFSLRRTGTNVVEVVKSPSFSDFVTGGQDIVVTPKPDRTGFVFNGVAATGDRTREIGVHVGFEFMEHLYFAHAERLRIAESAFGANPVLSPNAQDLPIALNHLQSNPGRLSRFNQYITQIFPTIRQVTVPPGGSGLQIAVWTVDPESEREDLAISLADSGTGVGQVLALLYVAITSPPPRSRTIIIDEPNSFLHPGAAKKLIEILRTPPFSHLQLVISTHSPEIIRSAQPEILFVVSWAEGASAIKHVKTNQLENLRLVLREVGVSLSDVFGADRVLWVEGATEELCFRLLIEKLLKISLLGTAIVAVQDTGQLLNKRRGTDLILNIYRRISEAGALMPPALAFSFDREGRSAQDIEDIRRRAGRQVYFLPRRMYENYLLEPEAISAVISTEIPVTAATITAWIAEHSSTFLPSEFRGTDRSSPLWSREINGAGLLERMFSEVSGNGVFFDKLKHGPMLTEWLIANRPESLAELSRYLANLMDQSRDERPQ